jgi:hypothetical protein
MLGMMRWLVSMAAAVWAGAALAAPAPGSSDGQVVEEVVAVIRSPVLGQTRVVTLTKLEEEGRIALVSRGALAAAVRPLDGAALQAALEWLIDQTVLIDEVNRLQVFDVNRAEVLAERDRFRARFSRADDYRAFLDRLDMSEEDLIVVLRRMLRVQRYLDSRIRGGRVRDAEVEAYWREHVAEFSGRDLAAVREPIRAHLAEERVKAEVKALLSDLRGRSEIRVLARLGAER